MTPTARTGEMPNGVAGLELVGTGRTNRSMWRVRSYPDGRRRHRSPSLNPAQKVPMRLT